MFKAYSLLSLIFFLVVGLIGFHSLKNLKTLYSVTQFLPTHHPAMIMDEKVRERFHLVDRPIFIGVIRNQNSWFNHESITELKKLTAELEALSGVHEIIDIANVQGARSENQTINLGKLIDLTPPNLWPARFLQDQMLSPNLVSKDGRTVVIYAALDNGNADLMVHFLSDFRDKLKNHFPQSETSVGGVPAVQTDLGILLNKELRTFLVLTLLACVATLLLVFRSWSTLLMTVILTGFANLVAFSMMAYAGLAFTVLSATIPILVFIAVVSICVHVMLRVEEQLHEDALHSSGIPFWKSILKANKAVALPNFLGATTTCVGFLTLLTSDVPLIREYGIGVAAAIMLAWFFTSLGLIPLQMLLPPPRSRQWVRTPARWALWAVYRRRWITGGILLVAVISLIIGKNLYWTGKLFDELPAEHETRRTTEIIDQTMGGVIPVELTIELPKSTDWVEPSHLSSLDKLSDQLRQAKGVGSVISLPDFLRASGINSDQLPPSRQATAELYMLYSLADKNPLSQFLSTDEHLARMQIKIHDLPASEALAQVDVLKNLAQQDFPDAKISVGGMGAIAHIIHNEISQDLIIGFWPALLIITLLLAVIFRSWRWSLAAAIPNLLPPILLRSYLVLTHVAIKPSVAIIFSIALGLAFNNTVYALNRLRSLQKSPQELPVYRAFYLEGNPCLLSSLIFLVGFSVFLFSYFELNRVFGQCMMVAIVAGTIGDLILLPAMLRLCAGFLTSKGPLKSALPVEIE